MVSVDYSQINLLSVAVKDTDGAEVEGEVVVVPVLVPVDRIAELLSAYDPGSGTSPSVTYSRPLSRAILDALLRRQGEL